MQHDRLSKILGPAQSLESGHDPEHDEIEYLVTSEDGRTCKARAKCSSVAAARPSPEERIRNWFANYEPPQSVKVWIPHYYLCPGY